MQLNQVFFTLRSFSTYLILAQDDLDQLATCG
jgi:hypothetical protein